MASAAVDYNKRLREGYVQTKDLTERERLIAGNSKHSLSLLGGLGKQTEEMMDALRLPLEFSKYYKMVGVDAAKGVLVHGPCGSGKTSFVHAVASECGLPLLKLSGAEVAGHKPSQAEESIRGVFRKAESLKPSVIFIDDIDSICRRREAQEGDAGRRAASQLAGLIDGMGEGVVVVAATSDPDSLDPALRRSGRMDKEIKMCVPVEPERREIVQRLAQSIAHEELDWGHIAKHTPGFVGADLKALVAEAGQACVKRGLREIGEIPDRSAMPTERRKEDVFKVSAGDFAEALKRVQPSAKKEGFVVIPDVDFEDIGALEQVKEVLDMNIVRPSLEREKFESVGIRRPSGVMLCGPPGCGKTMLAKAIAGKSHCNFISVKGPELISMYVGESERAIRKVFSRARLSQPCVIFFDEIDSICARRGSSAKYGDTLVNQLLVEMDGLEERGEVYLIGATNRLDIVDKALLRPGRFDKVIEVLPPTAAEAAEILAKKIRSISVEEGFNPKSLDLRGFTGAEIEMVVREAGMLCLQEDLCSEAPTIRHRHFAGARERVARNREAS